MANNIRFGPTTHSDTLPLQCGVDMVDAAEYIVTINSQRI